MDFFDSANRFGRFQERMTCFGRLRVLPRGENVSYRPSACLGLPGKDSSAVAVELVAVELVKLGCAGRGERKKEL